MTPSPERPTRLQSPDLGVQGEEGVGEGLGRGAGEVESGEAPRGEGLVVGPEPEVVVAVRAVPEVGRREVDGQGEEAEIGSPCVSRAQGGGLVGVAGSPGEFRTPQGDRKSGFLVFWGRHLVLVCVDGGRCTRAGGRGPAQVVADVSPVEVATGPL